MNKKEKILELLNKNSLVFTNIDKLFLFISSAMETSVEEVKKLFYQLVSNGDVFVFF